MTTRSTLSMHRIHNLLMIEAVTLRKAIYIALGCIAGIAFLRSFGSLHGEADHHGSFLGVALFMGGAVFTSFSFRELRSGPAAISYMMLPGNLSEKFIAKYLTAAPLYAVAVTLAYFVGSSLGEGVRYMALGTSHGLYNPLDPESLRTLWGYMTLSAIFFYGAARFQNYHFLKTVLMLLVVALVIGILTAITFRVVFHSYFDGMKPKAEYVHMAIMAKHHGLKEMASIGVEPLMRVLGIVVFNVLLPGITLLAAWFRMKELEV